MGSASYSNKFNWKQKCHEKLTWRCHFKTPLTFNFQAKPELDLKNIWNVFLWIQLISKEDEKFVKKIKLSLLRWFCLEEKTKWSIFQETLLNTTG